MNEGDAGLNVMLLVMCGCGGCLCTCGGVGNMCGGTGSDQRSLSLLLLLLLLLFGVRDVLGAGSAQKSL